MEDRIGEMFHLNTSIPYTVQDTMHTLLSFHHLIICRPFLFSGRPCMRETNDCHNDQQFCDRMLQLSTSVKDPKKIIQYSNLIEHDNL
ncbi:hypothetical protein TNCV_76871 [Trichonephila clavipes]|nr:hypothetical protein TNCV_76871 [Trichonephila clavipes]